MTVSRLRDIPGIGVDKVGDAADAAADPQFLRLENLDTDLRPPQVALEATHAAIDRDDANSYLPFQGHLALREAACAHVSAMTGRSYDPGTGCVSVAGGLNGILNVLLATVEPGQEVVICDPVYAGLVNRIRLAGGVPRFVSCTSGPGGWATDPDELAAAIGPRTAAVLLMSPVMPTGAVLGGEHFDAIADPVSRHRAWVIWDAAMERIRFDGQQPVHPGAHPGLADRTITVGSASKELRMIGWRVGWVAGPEEIMADIGLSRPHQRGLPGRHRPARRRRRPEPPGIWRRCRSSHPGLAAAQHTGPGPARRVSVRPPARRLVAAHRHPLHGPHSRGSIPAAVHPRPGRRHPDGWLGAQRQPVPAPGLRQRTRRTAHRPARPLRHGLELTTHASAKVKTWQVSTERARAYLSGHA